MKQRPTMQDIADSVGVSVSAVSLALSGKARVSKETAERIQAEANRLGYVANKAASALRTQKSAVVAVCLCDLSNPVFNEILVHIENTLRAHGCVPLLGVMREDKEEQARFLRTAISQGVSALMICPVRGTTAEDLSIILPNADRGAPIQAVLLGRTVENVPLPQFATDDAAAGVMMARRIVQAGHVEIHWIGGGHPTSSAKYRFGAFKAEMERLGATLTGVHFGPTSREFGYTTADRILAERGSDLGLVCFSDLVAFGALTAAHRRGFKPGAEVSIIGCDDMSEAPYSTPPLTTVWIDKESIGRHSAECAIGLSDGGPPGLFSPRPVERETVRGTAQS